MKFFTLTLLTFYVLTTFGQDVATNTINYSETPLNKKVLIHHNYDLNKNINLKDADIVPIYKGCEDKVSNLERQNCLNTHLIIDARTKFIASNAPKIAKLKKGLKRIRILFIIGENGKIRVKQILGSWSKIITNEMKIAMESLPKMKPAIQNNKNISVKYSIKIPFNVK